MDEMPGIVPCPNMKYTEQPTVLTTVSNFVQGGEETQVSKHAK